MNITREEIAAEIADFLSVPIDPLWEEGWFDVKQWGIFLGKDRDQLYKRLRAGEESKKLEKDKRGHYLYYRSVDPELREKMVEFWRGHLKENPE